jgi:hypothetical protein
VSAAQRSLTAHQVWSIVSFDREVRCQPNWMLSAELLRAGSGVTGIAIAAVAASRLPASKTNSVRRVIFSAIPGAQITILSLVALVAKNVHWSCSLDDAPRQSTGLHRWGMQPDLRGPEPVAIKTKLAFDGLRMIKSLIGIPALLGDT